ncbi:hypothetical protein [Nostoc sp. ChiQUE01b]|uniref:hypothetical protein n=1 Tax=Nostoc sp. ChiQUE01b TaxID=3075376 RepID=UPI002AD27E51|nr:hypothetical protein [Nostoc sp. ChiQUE01b]MDZ8241472.1 hypothetical protein [Nostoc sp. ChiQUE01a]MDZ8262950.1 hypothetical protein [Nostoc sp. ChiQUE01b]
MQDKNQDKSQKSASTPNGTIAASIVNFLNSLSENFQLSQREAQLHQQCLENTKTSKLLREKQEFINEANHQMPILLTSKSRLIVLESILVARARDGKPIDDLVTAIELLRKDLIKLDTPSIVNLQNQLSPKPHKTKDTVITHRHQYDFPILSEVGALIGDVRNLILFLLIFTALSVLILPITNPKLCNSWNNSSDTYENNSLYCQIIGKFNSLFSDYQKSK